MLTDARHVHESPPGEVPLLRDFVRALARPIADELHRAGGDAGRLPTALIDRRRSLALAESILRGPARPTGARPVHVAVIGPTQTGKSSIVNALLGAPAAEVSPLAGYTIHPHAFWCGDAPLPADCDAWLRNMRRVDPAALSRDALDTFTVRPAPSGAIRADLVLWDTPDFDSLAAQTYQQGLLEVLARADAYLLVLSKEKYADLSAWKMLRLLAPLSRPLAVALNKMTPDAISLVPDTLRTRLSELGGAFAQANIITLPYLATAEAERSAALFDAAAPLREIVVSWAGPQPPSATTLARGVARYLRTQWNDWTAPLEVEFTTRDAWHQAVRLACDRFLEAYRRDYLDDPQRYDSFRRATVELLRLLEIPGVSAPLAHVRQVVSWPVRKLFGLGQDWYARRRGTPVRVGEAGLLESLTEALLLELRTVAAREAEAGGTTAPVWSALRRRLDEQSAELQRGFETTLRAHAEQSAAEVHRTADELYRLLQEQPAALNVLRAARATADVGGILIAIKTGGAHINDVLLAPAMLALTTLMTEGTLGAYMQRSAAALKERLFARVKNELIEARFIPRLEAVGANLAGDGLIGLRREQLAEAEAALAKLEQAA
jgi:hypothetical protein